ncbi:MAG: hypothetical protein IJ306_02530 [Oscillospiraceae bacterium]|nr:hypothetical protein [Oscillospiraceae bacterium]
MAEIVETDNKIVETKGKIVDSEEFLAEFERVFGKNAEYFMAAAAMRTTPEVKMPAGMPENPSSVADGDSSSSEELVHRAEVFERMAFKLKEERELLEWIFRRSAKSGDIGFCICDGCAYWEQLEKCIDTEKFCRCDESEECEECVCGLCCMGNRFVFDPKRMKKLKEVLK